MAIEGPLRELGIHDVFQLLDLSRKTGALRVRSAVRDNDGTVYFAAGHVVYATIRSNPHRLGQLLLRAGKIAEADLERARAIQETKRDGRRLGQILVDIAAITPGELEHQVRQQIEAVIFELMSWHEGFFSFEEGASDGVPADATVVISMESLLMEGARRIDEWSRISDKVPHPGVVPILVPADEAHPLRLDLLPHEWEVLTMIDGAHDLRAIAAALARSDFDIAKIAYGLVTTGVIDLRNPDRVVDGSALPLEDPAPFVVEATEALARGNASEGLAAARRAISLDGRHVEARLLAAQALGRLDRHADALEELRRAEQVDSAHPSVQFYLGWAAARRGELPLAIASWTRFLESRPGAAEADTVRDAVASAQRLYQLIEIHHA